ncbi:MAG: hypothetical protein U1F98_03605 [Verrucomicrobiota bacterium]
MFLAGALTATGQNWLQTPAPTGARYLGISADGQTAIAVVSSAMMTISRDAGMTWSTTNLGIGYLYSAAISSDGVNLVAASASAVIRSTDGGVTWTNLGSPAATFSSLASSGDGSVLIAGTSSSTVYVSTDAGASWQSRLSSGLWRSVVASDSGQWLAAASISGAQQVYLSSDYGNNWYQVTNTPVLTYRYVAGSKDGQTLAVLSTSGVLVLTTNAGNSWITNATPSTSSSYLAGAGNPYTLLLSAKSTLYSSTNYGTTWVSNNVPNNRTYSYTVGAANGGAWLTVGSDSQVYSSPAALPSYRPVVASWGVSRWNQTIVPNLLTNAAAITASSSDSLAILKDGTVAVWGDNSLGQTNMPAGLTNIVSLAASSNLSLAIRNDGTVAGWGISTDTNIVPSLSNVVAAATSSHGFYSVLRNDGTVFSWGVNTYGLFTGLTKVPAGLSNVVAVAEGLNHSLALRENGSVVAWGNVLASQTPVLTDGVAIAAGDDYSLVLRSDGTLNGFAATYTAPLVPTLSNVVAIAAAYQHALALTSEGLVVEWATTGISGPLYQVGLSNVIAIACGDFHSLAIVGDGSPCIVRQPTGRVMFGRSSITLSAGAVAPPPHVFQWQKDGIDIPGATSLTLSLTNLQAADSGVYRLAVTNGMGFVLSSNANLVVIAGPPVILVQPTNTPAGQGSGATLSVGLAPTAPPIGYQWQLNQTNLPAATNATLVVTNAQAGNAGPYDVVITNPYGSTVSSNAWLNLVDLPTALNATNLVWSVSGPWLPETSFAHDGFAAANCVVNGTWSENLLTAPVIGPGTVEFWWRLTGPWSLDTSAFFGIDWSGLLPSSIVTSISLRNSGSDWTHVTGFVPAGEHYLVWDFIGSGPGTNFVDEVTYTPGATKPLAVAPPDQVLPGGTNVTFIQSIGGTPPLYCEWSLRGTTLLQQTNSVSTWLSLSNLQSSDSGIYSVLVTNLYGSTNVNFSLTVTSSPPVILTHPASQQAALTGAVEFRVLARGSDPLSYQWNFNGYPLPGEVNPCLLLTGLRTNQAGIYTVLVSNAWGTAVSSNAVLVLGSTALVAWGGNQHGECNVPLSLSNVTVFAAGDMCSLAADSSGALLQWGTYAPGPFSPPPTNVLSLSSKGGVRALALNGNGTLSSAGFTAPGGLSNVVGIAMGFNGGLALKADGTLSAWGDNSYGQTNPPPGLSNIIAIAAGNYHFMALRQDGTLAAWGNPGNNQTNIPPGLSNIVAIAAGSWHDLALRNDGTVVAWGNVIDDWEKIPGSVSNVVAIAGGNYHSLLLKSDGSLVGYGDLFSHGLTNIPSSATNVIAISCGDNHDLALVGSGAPVRVLAPQSQSVLAGNSPILNAGVVGNSLLTYQWQFNGTNIVAATNALLYLNNIPITAAGSYRCIVTNSLGSVTTATANVNVSRLPLQFDPSVSVSQNPASGMPLRLINLAGAGTVLIEASPDLVHWQPILIHDPMVGTLDFIDYYAGSSSIRSYRGSEGSDISAGPLTIVSSSVTGGQFLLQVGGLTGHGHIVLRSSTNLLDWQAILTNPPTAGFLQLTDPVPVTPPMRYYRVEEQ